MSIQYKKFQSAEEADAWVEKYKSCFPSDNDDDKIFLQAIDYYTGSLKPIYNNYLRNNKLMEEDNYFYPYFLQMLNKLPTYEVPDNIIVYRYIDKRLLKEICETYPPKRGSIMHDKGFMSTSLVRESTSEIRMDRNSHILLVISVPKGTKGTYVDLLHDSLPEYEIILAPNTKLRINEKSFFNNYFECTVIS